MSDSGDVGKIVWTDLTVPDAEAVRDFYKRVVGWTHAEVDMGGYADFSMMPPGAPHAVTGICHARGMNADMPPQWLIYIMVASLDQSIAECEALGGAVIVPPRDVGPDRLCVIRDPAGAVAALYQRGATPA
ncbi:MAG: VOC family protein [Anaerolineae bacterium]|nr:VOC family protein [Anaerolineae bacterium]